MKHENSNDNGEKAGKNAENVEPRHIGELAIENARGDHDEGGEKHIVNRAYLFGEKTKRDI